MVRYSKSDFIDVDLYEQRMRKNGYVTYDYEGLGLDLDYLQSSAATLASFAKDVMAHKSGGRYYQLNKESVYAFLTKYERCPEHYFDNKKVQGISLDMKRVLEKLRSNGYAAEFLEYYCAHRSLESKCNSIKGILQKCHFDVGFDKHGVALRKIPYCVGLQKNLRCNYHDFDIISQIPKEFVTRLGVEDGYFLAWGDFAQSDFRIAYNLFLRSPENDKIMNSYEDKYEALARIVASTMGITFDYDHFLQERPLYKQLTLATMYGTRSSVVKEEREFIDNFVLFLNKQPKYVEYEARLNKRVELNLPITIESYFGNQESIAIRPYSKVDTVNDALNSPIQTGTSEIVMRTVNSILDEYYAMGYTDDDVSIYITRHDEPVFRFSERVKKDLWVLEQYKEIFVDGWSPLHLDFDLGYNYKISDSELVEAFKQSIECNKDKIVTVTPRTDIDTEYYPVRDVCVLTVHYYKTPLGAVATYYEQKTNSVEHQLIESQDDGDIAASIKMYVREIVVRSYNHGLRGMLVLSNFVDGEDYYNKTYVKYKIEKNTKLDEVSKLCRFMTCRFCKSKGLDSPVDPPAESDADWILAVNTGIYGE